MDGQSCHGIGPWHSLRRHAAPPQLCLRDDASPSISRQSCQRAGRCPRKLHGRDPQGYDTGRHMRLCTTLMICVSMDHLLNIGQRHVRLNRSSTLVVEAKAGS